MTNDGPNLNVNLNQAELNGSAIILTNEKGTVETNSTVETQPQDRDVSCSKLLGRHHDNSLFNTMVQD